MATKDVLDVGNMTSDPFEIKPDHELITKYHLKTVHDFFAGKPDEYLKFKVICREINDELLVDKIMKM